MSIPDYQSLMLPLLEALADGRDHQIADLYDQLSDRFGLSEHERESRLPSGRETYIKNRVSWARTYLKKAGLVESPQKGAVKITGLGRKILAENPTKINNVYLRRFEGFKQFRPRSTDKLVEEAPGLQDDRSLADVSEDGDTPEELFDRAYQNLREELASDLLDVIKQSSPYFFEKLVVDLMLAMGYGGSKKDAGEATKRSSDGGVDGVIKLDKLGLDTICLQAKRYTSEPIGEPQIRDFVGALQGYRAKKGVFITTSEFTRSALEYVNKIETKIVLIDGSRLALLMIDYGVGVSANQMYEIKSIDTDYFSD